MECLAAAELDDAVDDSRLLVTVGHRSWWADGVPLEIPGQRGRHAVGTSDGVGGIIEGDRVRFVGDRPLFHRRVARVLGPQAGALDQQRVGTPRHVPVGDVEQRMTGARQGRPVPRLRLDDPIAGDQPLIQTPLILGTAQIPGREQPSHISRQRDDARRVSASSRGAARSACVAGERNGGKLRTCAT